MLISNTVKQKWNSRNKSYYVNLGYNFTKMGNEFDVLVEHLSKGSIAQVIVKCDYCGVEYKKPYANYLSLKNESFLDKDCCSKCKWKKIQDTLVDKYGDPEIMSAPNAVEKRKKTNIQRYGSENVFASEEIKNKIVDTNLKKYGVKNYQQTQESKDRYKNFCMEKYGVPCFLLIDYSGDKVKGENSPRWKGGVKYHRQERSTSEYIDWRKEVFERDHFTCQCCHKHSTYLNAHHLYNWKDYPDFRYDIDNGVTLCTKCHTQFHSEYGKQNNIPDQFYEFISQDKKIC